MAAPPARARADYDYLIKLLLIGDSGMILHFCPSQFLFRFVVSCLNFDSIRHAQLLLWILDVRRDVQLISVFKKFWNLRFVNVIFYQCVWDWRFVKCCWIRCRSNRRHCLVNSNLTIYYVNVLRIIWKHFFVVHFISPGWQMNLTVPCQLSLNVFIWILSYAL